MSDGLFASAVVPIADEADAGATARAIAPHVGAGDRLTVVHVVEKAGGAPDKASVEQREAYAQQVFEAFEAAFDGALADRSLDGDVAVETDVLYGTDVADAILSAAGERDGSAIAYTSRGLSRWVEFLTGNVDDALLDSAGRPVVVLPTSED